MKDDPKDATKPVLSAAPAAAPKPAAPPAPTAAAKPAPAPAPVPAAKTPTKAEAIADAMLAANLAEHVEPAVGTAIAKVGRHYPDVAKSAPELVSRIVASILLLLKRDALARIVDEAMKPEAAKTEKKEAVVPPTR
jgi:hypothetical protein